jgi:predicted permease
MFSILGYLCIFKIFRRDNPDYWIQSVNIFFGIGGLIGPLIVIAYEEMAMRYIGLSCFFLVVPFFFLKSP